MGLFTRGSSVPTPRPVEAPSAARPTNGHLNGARQVAGETSGAGAATRVMPLGESPSARRFGELLVADGIITQDQLDAASDRGRIDRGAVTVFAEDLRRGNDKPGFEGHVGSV